MNSMLSSQKPLSLRHKTQQAALELPYNRKTPLKIPSLSIKKRYKEFRRTATMAVDSSSSEAKVHIVYTERPEGEEPEAYHIKTLTSVLGSEDAAKEALVYSYKHAASGFSAKLTPDQVSQLSKQPGVLQVVPSQTVQLHSGPGKTQV